MDTYRVFHLSDRVLSHHSDVLTAGGSLHCFGNQLELLGLPVLLLYFPHHNRAWRLYPWRFPWTSTSTTLQGLHHL